MYTWHIHSLIRFQNIIIFMFESYSVISKLAALYSLNVCYILNFRVPLHADSLGACGPAHPELIWQLCH